MPQPQTSSALPSARSAKRPLLSRLAEAQWALTGLGLALLVLLLLPSAQIKLGASQLNGLVGSYTSGGHYWQVSYSSSGTTNWRLASSGRIAPQSHAWSTTGSGDGIQASPALDASTKGTVTPTLTWVPATGQTSTTDPPSSSVIVTESGSASSTGGGSGAPTLNDGLGDPPNGNTASGTHYVVKDGSSGTITLSAFSLEATTPTGTGTNGGSVSVSASLTVSGASVTVDPGGTTTVNNTLQALVGQQIAASVNCPVGTITSYNWAATGNVFKTYNENFTSNQKIALSSDNGDYTGQHLFFYDVTKDDSVTVTCYPNIKLPDGTTLNFAVKSQPVKFKKPLALWKVKEGFIRQFTLSKYPNSLLYGLGPDPDPATVAIYPDGEDWFPVDITMPDGFSSSGQCGFTQLATPNFTQTHNGSTTGGPAPQGLDNAFAFGQWTLPGQGNSGDSPCFITNSSINASYVAGDQRAFYNQFTTYLMYRPPAVGNQLTIWAPLQSYSWSARTTITYDGSQWNIVSAQSAPMTPSAVTIKGTNTDTPPQWSVTYTNGQ